MASRLSLNQVQGCRGRGVVNLDLNLDLNTVGTSHDNGDNLNLIENTPRTTKQGEGNTFKHIEIDNDKW